MLALLYTLSPANLTVYLKVPFLVTLTFMEATPFEFVLAENVLPLTLRETFLPEITLFPDFNVILTVFAFFTFKVAFGAFRGL